MKQHPLCTDTEHAANVMDLAVPAELKQEWAALQTRRHFLGRSGKVLGWAAMASLLGDRSLRGDSYTSDAKGQPGAPLKLPHFAPKAKRAIYLFMSGGPSQVDAAISDFTGALELDSGNAAAKFDLELLLRLGHAQSSTFSPGPTHEKTFGSTGHTGPAGAAGGRTGAAGTPSKFCFASFEYVTKPQSTTS